MWAVLKNLPLSKNNWKIRLWFISKLEASLQPITMAYKVYENDRVYRNASPLVVTHGLLESKDHWDKTCQTFMRILRRRVYAVDLRNHGDSPHTEEHNDQELAADLFKFINDQNLSKIQLLGQGIGGRAMMFFALKYPQLVECGIILDLLTLSVPHGLKDTIELLLAMKFTQLSLCANENECKAAVLRNIKHSQNRPELVQLILHNLRKRENGEFYWTINIDGLLSNIKHLSSFMMYIKPMEPFTNPMMFLCGNDSDFINVKTWPAIKILFPTSEMHWLNIRELAYAHQSDQFCQLVFNFLCE